MERQAHQFSTRQEFGQHVTLCLSRAQHTLQLFDPDFAMWELGSSEVDALLRHFLSAHGRLQLVAHSNTHLELRTPFVASPA